MGIARVKKHQTNAHFYVYNVLINVLFNGNRYCFNDASQLGISVARGGGGGQLPPPPPQ